MAPLAAAGGHLARNAGPLLACTAATLMGFYLAKRCKVRAAGGCGRRTLWQGRRCGCPGCNPICSTPLRATAHFGT
jgi:hypothetical protein